MFQKEDTSSIEKSRPPTGAPNAEATPAAAPAEIKLRLEKGIDALKITKTYFQRQPLNFIILLYTRNNISDFLDLSCRSINYLPQPFASAMKFICSSLAHQEIL